MSFLASESSRIHSGKNVKTQKGFDSEKALFSEKLGGRQAHTQPGCTVYHILSWKNNR